MGPPNRLNTASKQRVQQRFIQPYTHKHISFSLFSFLCFFLSFQKILLYFTIVLHRGFFSAFGLLPQSNKEIHSPLWLKNLCYIFIYLVSNFPWFPLITSLNSRKNQAGPCWISFDPTFWYLLWGLSAPKACDLFNISTPSGGPLKSSRRSRFSRVWTTPAAFSHQGQQLKRISFFNIYTLTFT